ncbi:MAG: dihydropteroate synthase, partial [Planctomycetota bacterium]
GTMLVGSSIEAAASALRHYPITSLGLNCATGPTEMAEYVRFLGERWDRTVAVVPNAGLPVLVEGRTEYPLQPKPFTEAVMKFVEEFGLGIVGGCCGTTPEHIRELAKAVEGHAPKKVARTPLPASSTSLYQPTEHRQDNSFLIVGERCNASGSRKFKRLLEEEDWDSIVSLAREQMRDGSHVLDINVDYAGRDNAADMAEVVKRFSRQVDAPLMIDSTQVATIEAGLSHAAGKCIINSANFEDGEEKFDEICRLARTYNSALVIGTIDEDPEAAMARTADRKFSIAKRGIERAAEVHGIDVADIFIDPLVLPISTGMDTDRRSALELIEGTRQIAETFPEVQLTCGLSNVSFGL